MRMFLWGLLLVIVTVAASVLPWCRLLR